MALSLGYLAAERLPDGRVIAVRELIYTHALCVGLDSFGFERRYCYERRADALHALQEWDGSGDPPGPWIKEKPSERLGPGATEDAKRYAKS